MFFFFFYDTKAVAYTSLTTTVPKYIMKGRGNIDFDLDSWLRNRAAVKRLISLLPDIEQFKHGIRFEAEPLDRKAYDPDANVYVDLLSSNSKRRVKLESLINGDRCDCIFITDIRVLGDNTEQIADVYRKFRDNDKGICIIDELLGTEPYCYSTMTEENVLLPVDKQNQIIEKISTMNDSNSFCSRGKDRKSLTYDFWCAYFAYEITCELPEEAAITLSGVSKNTFHSRCLEMERKFDQFMLSIDGRQESYVSLLAKSFLSKGLNPADFYYFPKRYGPIPQTDSDKRMKREAAYDYIPSFNQLMKKMDAFEKQLDVAHNKQDYVVHTSTNTSVFIESDSSRNTISAEKIEKLQAELSKYCRELKLPSMLYFNYTRYAAKMQKRSHRLPKYSTNYDPQLTSGYYERMYHNDEAGAKEFLRKKCGLKLSANAVTMNELSADVIWLNTYRSQLNKSNIGGSEKNTFNLG